MFYVYFVSHNVFHVWLLVTESGVGVGGYGECHYSQAVDNSLPTYSEVVHQRTVGLSSLELVHSLLLLLLYVCVNSSDQGCMIFN